MRLQLLSHQASSSCSVNIILERVCLAFLMNYTFQIWNYWHVRNDLHHHKCRCSGAKLMSQMDHSTPYKYIYIYIYIYTAINSLAPRSRSCILKCAILTHIIIETDIFTFSVKLPLISQYLTYDRSTLVRVLAWCRQTTSHYPNLWCPDSVSWSPSHNVLTHWGRDQMAALFQSTLPNTFSWMKIVVFQFIFSEIYSQGSNYQYASIG